MRRLWVEAVLVERLLYCAACGGRLYRGHALVLKVIEGSEVKPGDMVFIVSTQAPPAYDAGVILEAKGSLYGEEGELKLIVNAATSADYLLYTGRVSEPSVPLSLSSKRVRVGEAVSIHLMVEGAPVLARLACARKPSQGKAPSGACGGRV